MKEHRLIGAFALVLLTLCIAGIARAQTPPGTRITKCDPLTPNNALCISWPMPTTNTDGTPTVLPMTYRVEQQMGAGAWTQVATGLTVTQLYLKNLTIGTYTFRVYANCTLPTCVESAPALSNSRDTSAPAVQPTPPTPVIVARVTISADHAPVYRVIGATPARGEMYGLVPVGRECKGDVLFRYRGAAFRLVDVQPDELWGTADATKLAAPCT